MKIEDFKFDWPSEASVEGNTITMYAPPDTDFYCNPGDQKVSFAGPFLHKEITGDFVMSATVHVDFEEVADGAGFLIMQDQDYWSKAVFELSPQHTHVVNSCATRGLTDDANGQVFEGHDVFLQYSRKGDTFAIHFKNDKGEYCLFRIFVLPVAKTIKAGMIVQCPFGKGLKMSFTDFKLENKTVTDQRIGL